MRKGSLYQLAYALAIVGGILMVVFALLGFIGMAVSVPFSLPFLGIFSNNVITLILGVVAIILSKRVGKMMWAVVLIVVGYIGGGIGGLLVLIGGILGLLSHFT